MSPTGHTLGAIFLGSNHSQIYSHVCQIWSLSDGLVEIKGGTDTYTHSGTPEPNIVEGHDDHHTTCGRTRYSCILTADPPLHLVKGQVFTLHLEDRIIETLSYLCDG